VITVGHIHLFSQESNGSIRKVHLIFKTHLDIGFTGLSSEIEQQYMNEFIPKTLAAIEKLKAEKAEERYVWTTGSWLVWGYLQQASPEAIKNLEKAIVRGDIVWHGMPYTVESEMMSRDLFETCLQLSQQLDNRFGKKTIAAKMTDVPGHTRSIITPLSDAGITFLHIGVNPASAIPDVPPVCRWRNIDGKEIILMYQGTYGEDMLLPDNETVVSINLTNDNHGPHTIKQIKEIYATARTKYPNARIMATSLNEVAADLQEMADKLPIITSEIGDTWIYGFGSSPVRIARYRALSRLYSQWLEAGKLDKSDITAINFAIRLGLVAEHTWGMDVKTFLKNWDKYDVDVFREALHTPAFKQIEQSWAEMDENIEKAINILPARLQKEARKAISDIGKTNPAHISGYDKYQEIDKHGAYNMSINGTGISVGRLIYQTYSAADYTEFQNAYLRNKYQWAIEDFGKPGLEGTKSKSVTIVADLESYTITKKKENTIIRCNLKFPFTDDIDPRILPETVNIEYIISSSGNGVEVRISLANKPPNRLPEAYLLSFEPQDIVRILAQKTGYMVDVADVVSGGNRQMHAIDNHIDIITQKGIIKITSFDAPIAVIGQPKMLNYSLSLPDLKDGVHFCLFNNLWGTNFSMWWGGSITYRFYIELKNRI
jgi:hypothetical protein